MGRRIFDNLRKATAYIISVHVPIAGASLIPVLLGWPIILYPVHIVFLELIIDPACSIVFESETEESNIMRRPPRSPKTSMFSRRLVILSLLQGLFSLLVVTGVFEIARRLGQSEANARTLAFTTLVISNLCLILSNRSWSRSILGSLSVYNKSLTWVIAGATLFLGLAIYVPILQRLFHFERLHGWDILISLLAGVLSVIWFEVVKIFAGKNNAELLKS
jgi:Ca2+-transporting ATPase